MSTAIIGAGASGLACAIKLKMLKPSEDVTVFERLKEPGKKILATGNGRCNLTNVEAENFKEVTEFFNSIGVVLREEEGRIYPYSLKATTVRNALVEVANKLHVNIVTDCNVEKVCKGFTLYTSESNFNAENVVVATGGMAQSALGSNGSGYEILKSFGHKIVTPCPALVQLTTNKGYLSYLKGTRTRATVTIKLDGETVATETGEVLFTGYGISGIAVMDLSQAVSQNFAKSNPCRCTAHIDLTPEMSEADLARHIEKFGNLHGILGDTISGIILKQAGGDKKKCPQIAKNYRLIVTGTKGFDFAQITAGGVSMNEVDNFKSCKVNNLYITGEVLDRQFKCGGFNLDFAWHSGIAAAKEIAGKTHDQN